MGLGVHDEPKAQSAPRGVLVYVSVIGCIGAGVIGHSVWQVATAPFDSRWLWLVALTVACSAAVLQLSTSRVAFSVAEIFTFSAVLWEAMPFIVLGAVVAGVLEELLPQQLLAKVMPNLMVYVPPRPLLPPRKAHGSARSVA